MLDSEKASSKDESSSETSYDLEVSTYCLVIVTYPTYCPSRLQSTLIYFHSEKKEEKE